MVVRRALEVYARSTEALSPQLLTRVIASAPNARVRMLLRGARQLDKWEGLKLLLIVTASPDPERRTVAMDEIHHWIGASNRRFTAPSPAMTEEIGSLLRATRIPEHGADWRKLTDSIDRA